MVAKLANDVRWQITVKIKENGLDGLGNQVLLCKGKKFISNFIVLSFCSNVGEPSLRKSRSASNMSHCKDLDLYPV